MPFVIRPSFRASRTNTGTAPTAGPSTSASQQSSNPPSTALQPRPTIVEPIEIQPLLMSSLEIPTTSFEGNNSYNPHTVSSPDEIPIFHGRLDENPTTFLETWYRIALIHNWSPRT